MQPNALDQKHDTTPPPPGHQEKENKQTSPSSHSYTKTQPPPPPSQNKHHHQAHTAEFIRQVTLLPSYPLPKALMSAYRGLSPQLVQAMMMWEEEEGIAMDTPVRLCLSACVKVYVCVCMCM